MLSVSLGAVEAEPAARLVRTAPGLGIAVDVELVAGSQPALAEPVAQAPPATVEDSEVVAEAEARDDVLAVIFSSQDDDGLWRDLLGSEEP